MLIFTIIIFGLATIRTIVPMAKKENVNLAQIILAVTMIVAYVWFLKQFVSLNGA